MIFDIYGRFQVEVVRVGASWRAYRRNNGLRAPYPDLVIPDGLKESELAQFLDDHFHEYAQLGQVVRRMQD